MYSRKFIKRFNEAQSFEAWLDRLRRFDFSLIKENNLQGWTLADFKRLWNQYKEAKV